MGAEHVRRPDVAPSDPTTGGIAQRSSPAACQEPIASGGSGMPRPPEVSSDPVTAYLRARAVTETYKARTAQLEYEERAGKLIPATQAGEYASSFSNIARDQVSAWADRLTPVLMPFFAPGTDEAVIHRLLMREGDAALRKISKAIADAGY
jgi:hypothetical protein